MADKQEEEKFRVPLATLLALLATISSLLIYEGMSLNSPRPVDKEKASNIDVEKELVQSRLW